MENIFFMSFGQKKVQSTRVQQPVWGGWLHILFYVRMRNEMLVVVVLCYFIRRKWVKSVV